MAAHEAELADQPDASITTAQVVTASTRGWPRLARRDVEQMSAEWLKQRRQPGNARA